MRAACALLIAAAALTACSSSYDELVVQTLDDSPAQTGPIEGVRVQVNNLPWVTTDANGKATFKNVNRPFTVRTYLTFRTYLQWHEVGEVSGIDANPLVLYLNMPFYTPYRASITGSVAKRSGASGSLVQVMPAIFPVFPERDQVQVAADGTFTIKGSWGYSSTQTFVLHAFESDTTDPPTHYSGYGSASVPVSDPTLAGAAVTGVTVELGPVAQTRIAGNVTMAPALAGKSLRSSLSLEFPDKSFISLIRKPDAPRDLPGSFDYAVPIVGANTARILFSVFGTGGTYAGVERHVEIAEGAPVSGLSFDIPAPVPLLEPPDGAAIGPDTVFRWGAGPPGGTYTLSFGCNLEEGPPDYGQIMGWNIATTNTEARLFSTPFFMLVPGKTCGWGVSWNEGGPPAVASSRGMQALRWANGDGRTAIPR